PGVALVLHQDGQELVVLRHSFQVADRFSALRGVTRVFRIDLTAHRLRYVFSVPCSGDSVSFDVTAEVTCRVQEPRAVVEQRIDDAHAIVEPFVARQVHSISRAYTYRQVREAETRCAANVSTLVGVPLLGGALVIDGTGVSLHIDDEVRKSLHEGEVLEAQGKTKSLATQQELDHLQALFDRYQQWMPEGDRQLLAALVAHNRDHLPEVVRMVREDRRTTVEHTVNIVRSLIEQNKLDDYDLKPVNKWILEQLTEAGKAALPPAPAGPVITGETVSIDDALEPEGSLFEPAPRAAE
ncbi:MAG TPA: hypothetical protein VOB72_26300, partial [Candidatus Dormibacteraeota bacterium]|nr:hypothetical protein [Candidatus Dormibacteraeota bacterium]